MNKKEYHKMWREKNKVSWADYVRKWRSEHKEAILKSRNKSYAKYKKTVYDFYGRICKCCGETNTFFLTIDHVKNDGYKDLNKNGKRSVSGGIYIKIIKGGFPDSYQVLCWNCNCGKLVNKGICPHLGVGT